MRRRRRKVGGGEGEEEEEAGRTVEVKQRRAAYEIRARSGRDQREMARLVRVEGGAVVGPLHVLLRLRVGRLELEHLSGRRRTLLISAAAWALGRPRLSVNASTHCIQSPLGPYSGTISEAFWYDLSTIVGTLSD